MYHDATKNSETQAGRGGSKTVWTFSRKFIHFGEHGRPYYVPSLCSQITFMKVHINFLSHPIIQSQTIFQNKTIIAFENFSFSSMMHLIAFVRSQTMRIF